MTDVQGRMVMARLHSRIRHLEAELDAAAADRDMWREHCTAQAKLITALTDTPGELVVSKHVVALDGPKLADAFRTAMMAYERRNPPRRALER